MFPEPIYHPGLIILRERPAAATSSTSILPVPPPVSPQQVTPPSPNIPEIPRRRPRQTVRFRQVLEILDGLEDLHKHLIEVSESIPATEDAWNGIISLAGKIRAFLDVGSDRYFIYRPDSSVAEDADLEGVEKIRDVFEVEWMCLAKNA
ncbi:hypothetical protein RUND412_002349 [Rhizina undulata]